MMIWTPLGTGGLFIDNSWRGIDSWTGGPNRRVFKYPVTPVTLLHLLSALLCSCRSQVCGVQYTQTHSVVLYNGFRVYYFGFYVKSHGVYLSLYFLVFVMWLSTLLTIHFSFLLVCALCFLYLFVFKHVYFWLPYASAAVANSETVFARYFCGDRLPSHAIGASQTATA